ncbi:MAG: zinc-ribbon domain-containing protein [Synergistaceae bacterium]|nr:zinc-ribbon domain-containing protein [Synergistaceae bacterium]
MSGHFCGKCGISAGTEDVFCHRCGTELNIQAAHHTEYAASQRKICPQCGESVPMGDRFCGKCGAGQATPGFNTQIHTKKRATPSGVTTHRRRRGFLFGLISAVAFWGIVAGALYSVYKFLGSDIPWSDVIAMVTSTRPKNVPLPENADRRSEELPPIVPETPGSGNPRPQAVPIRGEPAAPGKPEWGTQDVNGYSILVLPGQEDTERADVSLRGVVTTNRVRLRSEPNTRSQIRGQFDSGKEFDVTGRYWSGSERFFWYGVSSGEDNGWMYGEYLRIVEE